LRTFAVRGPDEIGAAFFGGLQRAKAGALLVLPDPAYTPHAAQIAELASTSRLPAMYGTRDYAVAGGLMSYGTDFAALFRRAADYVDEILKGAKPAELPVEQPTRFEFVINLKAARQLGIAFPPALRARADVVIE